MTRTTILVTGPHRDAVSGVSTHVNLLLGSHLAEDFELVHFQVGSEGRNEGALGRLARLLASPFALFATILFRQVSVVHLNTSLNRRAYWRDLAYLLVAKLLRARVIWQVHGGMLPRAFFGNRALPTAFLRWTLGLPDLVAVLARSELEAYTELLPRQAVMIMPNGIDVRAFARVPTLRSCARRPLRVVYIGRLARDKGLYEALQGVRIAMELGVDAHLTIAGAGSEGESLERYSRAIGLATRVAFRGPVFGDDKVNLLAASDVAILPSYAEGLPYALLEAMAAGIPVLATSVGAIPDVMTHGIHGLLVPPRDSTAIAEAFAALVRDRERLSWMSRACRRRVLAAYSIERLAAELAVHYRALAGGWALRAAGPGTVDVERRSAPRAARTAPEFSRPRQ
jgi:glycosyltransferase involved in cell wall biosynthesis